MAARPAGRPNGEEPPGAAEQPALMLPLALTLSEKSQSLTALMSMYWLSQKSAPWGSEHLVVQPPVSAAVQSVSHLMLASTVQEAVQLSPHSVVQSVLPGCAVHFSVHWVSQLAEHEAVQPSPVQLAMQPAVQSVVQ